MFPMFDRYAVLNPLEFTIAINCAKVKINMFYKSQFEQ